MGFFDFLKKQENKTYTTEHAMNLIESEIAAADAARKEEMYRSAKKAYACFQDLPLILQRFRMVEAPPHAKGSQKVKDRFCEIAKHQVSQLAFPVKDSAPEFLRSSYILINGIGGLTERQLLHLKIFFNASMGPLAAKMSEINELVKPQTDSVASHRKAVALQHEIIRKNSEKETLLKKIHEQVHCLAELETRRASLAMPEGHVDRTELIVAEKRLQKTKQEIDSFLSIQKPLKKYVHDTGTKDGLINSYVESASAAILEDRNLRILDILGEIEKTEPGKLSHIISGEGFLKIKKSELLEAMRIENEARSRYDQRSSEIAATLMNTRRQHVMLDAEIRDCQKTVNDYTDLVTDIDKQISRNNVEFCILASDVLKANVA